jgi:homoserine kinase
LEGHPDNVAACLLGGATVAWSRLVGPPTIGALRLVPAAAIVPVVCVPATSVPTRKARGMLPESVPHADAAANSARAALLVAALTSRPDLLFEATVDRLHQSYRRSAFPASLELVEALRSAGIAAVISGAGPTVLALTDAARAPQVGDAAGAAFDTLALASDLEGACVQYDD